jgi:hypothetical protein
MMRKRREMETKRGRPRKYDYKELEQITEGVGSRAKTIRGRQNTEHAVQAYQIIRMTAEEGGLPDAERAKLRNLLDNTRPSVAAELGRFIGEEEDEDGEEGAMRFWEAVRFLADNPEMPAKKAIRYLRRLRLGGGNDADTWQALYGALVKVVNEYAERYPELDKDGVMLALEMTVQSCEESKYGEAASE